MMLYDVFISHASEDKDSFVRRLAERLIEEHIEVWYDEFSLSIGDSLRESIDRGLSQSRFGVVVLSTNFFSKNWPRRELNGLVAREMIGSDQVILPIWHGVTKEQVCAYSPPLADVVAISSARGVDDVVRALMRLLRPQGSPLIVARDRLIEYGLQPPVVTDSWWLDVIEASNRVYPWGFTISTPHWGRWSFPLPEGEDAFARGDRLAWTALQMKWVDTAEKRGITQLTPPPEVLDFIAAQPGLFETCELYPEMLAEYAPQLTIPGCGGPFEGVFDQLLAKSVEERGARAATSKEHALCDQWIALHHPSFGNHEPAVVACAYVQGELGGVSSRAYPHTFYLVWLLSDESSWLPKAVKDVLCEGMKDWPVWMWDEWITEEDSAFGLENYPNLGALVRSLAGRRKRPKLSRRCIDDVTIQFGFIAKVLGLHTPTQRIVERFLNDNYIEGYLKSRNRRR